MNNEHKGAALLSLGDNQPFAVSQAMVHAILHLADVLAAGNRFYEVADSSVGWVPNGFRAWVEPIDAEHLPEFLAMGTSKVGGIIVAADATKAADMHFGILRARGWTGDRILDAECSVAPGMIVAYAWAGSFALHEGRKTEVLRLGDILLKYVPQNAGEREAIAQWIKQRAPQKSIPVLTGREARVS